MLIKLTLQIPLHLGLYPCYIAVVVYELVIHYKCTSQQSMPAEFRYKWQRSQMSTDLSARGQDPEEGEGFYFSILTAYHKSRNWKTIPLLSSQLIKYFNSGRLFPVLLINIPGLNKHEVHTPEQSVRKLFPLHYHYSLLLCLHTIHMKYTYEGWCLIIVYIRSWFITNKMLPRLPPPSDKTQACSFQAG